MAATIIFNLLKCLYVPHQLNCTLEMMNASCEIPDDIQMTYATWIWVRPSTVRDLGPSVRLREMPRGANPRCASLFIIMYGGGIWIGKGQRLVPHISLSLFTVSLKYRDGESQDS
jgi:hypothetical protein